MTTIQGSFKELYDAITSITIQGTLEAGAIVRTGSNLIVQGAIAGPITIEEDGLLAIEGAYAADLVSNAGTLLVSGVADVQLERLTGKVGFAIGSAITSDRLTARQLQADGSLMELEPGADISVGRSKFCQFKNGAFIPMG